MRISKILVPGSNPGIPAMNDLFLLCRKIHRLSIFLTIPLGLVMTLTGLFLRSDRFVFYLTFVDLRAIRALHRNLSPVFAVVLLIMMLTGLFMYLFPWLNQKLHQNKINQNGPGN